MHDGIDSSKTSASPVCYIHREKALMFPLVTTWSITVSLIYGRFKSEEWLLNQHTEENYRKKKESSVWAVQHVIRVLLQKWSRNWLQRCILTPLLLASLHNSAWLLSSFTFSPFFSLITQFSQKIVEVVCQSFPTSTIQSLNISPKPNT